MPLLYNLSIIKWIILFLFLLIFPLFLVYLFRLYFSIIVNINDDKKKLGPLLSLEKVFIQKYIKIKKYFVLLIV